ncbi:anti-sigma factor RsbA family regulatory protein [Flindersiella endophytica]
MSMIRAAGVDPFAHPALFYRSDEEYLAGLVPFVVEGLAREHPVAVAVPGERLRILRDALAAGAVDSEVTLIDMTEAGRNPGRIIAGVLRKFADAHGRSGRHVRIIGEPIWPGRHQREYPACVQHEALINAAFAGRDVTILCPYDVTGLDSRAIADAQQTHPVVWEDGRRYGSDSYSPDTAIARYNQPLREPAPESARESELVIGSVDQILPARSHALEQAGRLGLPAARLPDLQLIVSELVTNSLVHANGGCRLRIWRDHDHLVCEVVDDGRLTDSLAGRRPAPPDQMGGRGLLMVNDLADLVRTHTTPHGTTQRAYVGFHPA